MTGLLLLLLLLLLAGWFFHCALRLRMARSLPMTMCGIVALLYLFALAGQLRAGVAAVSLLLLLMGGYAFVQTLRRRAWKETAALLLCPECVLFLLAFFAILYVDYGRVADSWDDFSHWADTVKLMFAHDALPTAAMGAQFPSYPPAMALLQYFVQRLGRVALLQNGSYMQLTICSPYRSCCPRWPAFAGAMASCAYLPRRPCC